MLCLGDPLTPVYAAQLSCDTSIGILFQSTSCRAKFLRWRCSFALEFEDIRSRIPNTSPLIFYVVFNIVRRPLGKLSLSAVFSFPGERNLKPEKERQESGRPLTSRSLGSSLKHSISHSAAYLYVALISWNGLRPCIPARLSCQASGLIYLPMLTSAREECPPTFEPGGGRSRIKAHFAAR